MKHVNAYPFVGKDYEKGFLNSGKKVLKESLDIRA